MLYSTEIIQAFWQKTVDSTHVRKIQYSTISEDGVLASRDTDLEQKGSNTKISRLLADPSGIHCRSFEDNASGQWIQNSSSMWR